MLVASTSAKLAFVASNLSESNFEKVRLSISAVLASMSSITALLEFKLSMSAVPLTATPLKIPLWASRYSKYPLVELTLVKVKLIGLYYH